MASKHTEMEITMTNNTCPDERQLIADIVGDTIVSMSMDGRKERIPDLVKQILSENLACNYGKTMRILVPFTRNAQV